MQKIELSEEHLKLRTILVFVLIAIGIGSLGIFLFSVLNKQPGWQEIQAASDQPNCGNDFTFQYDLSEEGKASTALYKKISGAYSEAAAKAFVLFSKDLETDRMDNVHTVNAHVNETVTVDPALYRAFALLEKYNSRALFLAPIYAQYRNLCSSDSDSIAAVHDPTRNPEIMDYFGQITGFVNNPHMIDLELLGNSQVRLKVSQEYLDFASAYEIESFLDFGWMSNAFIADFLADTLARQGFTNGYLSSYDGFTRTLDSRENLYSLNLFDRRHDAVYVAGRMEYQGPAGIVFLRNFSLNDRDRWNYYNWESGQVTIPYVDPADGLDKSTMNNLVSYSYDHSCAEVLLQALPVFWGYQQNPAALSGEKIYCVWSEDSHLLYNDPNLRILDLYKTENLQYTAKFVS